MQVHAPEISLTVCPMCNLSKAITAKVNHPHSLHVPGNIGARAVIHNYVGDAILGAVDGSEESIRYSKFEIIKLSIIIITGCPVSNLLHPELEIEINDKLVE